MIRLSLVISTYNRADRLLVALQSLVHQSADATEWECIVVDNNSTDDTRRIFEGFASCYPTLNLRMVTETAQGLSHARNRGLAESTGHIVAIIDDDERVNDRFVEAYAGFFDRHPEAVAAGGRVVPEYPSGRPGWLSRYTEVPLANPTDWGRPRASVPARAYSRRRQYGFPSRYAAPLRRFRHVARPCRRTPYRWRGERSFRAHGG